MATFPLTERAIVLRPEDDVAIAKKELATGTILEEGPARIEVLRDSKSGHKVERRRGRTGGPVRRYGQVIGFATQDIKAGDRGHLASPPALPGYAKHPNVAPYNLLGLGCGVHQSAVIVDRRRMGAPGYPAREPVLVDIQEAAGIRSPVDRAAAEVAKLLPRPAA